jgi:hypothetical protein
MREVWQSPTSSGAISLRVAARDHRIAGVLNQRSCLDRAKRFRAIPPLGATSHHREEVV